MTKQKVCKGCKQLLGLEHFIQRSRLDKNGNGYFFTKCKACYGPDKAKKKIAQEKYKQKSKDKARAALLQRNYNLLWAEYLELFEKQQGCCAICKVSLKLHQEPHQQGHSGVAAVDHDHKTGKVRGLLCRPCNSGIGFLQDSALLCKLASSYLEKNT